VPGLDDHAHAALAEDALDAVFARKHGARSDMSVVGGR
jgi:hypothetical protein